VIRLLLAEDSAVQRELLSYVIKKSGEFEIVGSVVDGAEAVRETERLTPDVVLMDCQMPKLDGIAATKAIMERRPTPIVVMTGSLVGDAVRFSFEAIGSGALAVVAKPTAVGSDSHERAVEHLVETVRLMSAVKVVRRWAEKAPSLAAPPAAPAVHRTRARVVAICGSTGAPGILADVLTAIRAKVESPVLIVQHISEGFISGFALWLEQRSGLPVEIARDGVETQPGRAYIAPDDAHLGINESGRIVLSDDPPTNGFRPSATNLFHSVARSFGAAAMGVLLSGMGRDGADGLLEMRRSGGVTAAQNEETCIVFGMPQEAIRLDAAEHVLAPSALGDLIVASTRSGG
jgi:two-component system, chemotaxis family, protein-glutamate methylesterase/glutaminase